jgi:peroxiredoxin
MFRKLMVGMVAVIAMAAGLFVALRQDPAGSPLANAPSPGAGASGSPAALSAALPRWQSFAFEDTQGQTIELKTLQGQMLVINFWATWCPPCVEEMPELDALYPQLQAKNIEMLGIGIDSPSNIREFLQKRKFSYRLLVGGVGGSDLARLLGNETGGLPFTVVIDTQGRVIFRKMGRITGAEVLKATELTQ